jgi:hypothetical protein
LNNNCYSYIDQQIKHQDERQQVRKQKDNSTFVLVVGVLNERSEGLIWLSSGVILRNCKAHDNANDEPTKVTEVINIWFCYSDLNIEEQYQQYENYQCESLHGVGFAKSGPFNAQVCNLSTKSTNQLNFDQNTYVISNEPKNGSWSSNTIRHWIEDTWENNTTKGRNQIKGWDFPRPKPILKSWANDKRGQDIKSQVNETGM